MSSDFIVLTLPHQPLQPPRYDQHKISGFSFHPLLLHKDLKTNFEEIAFQSKSTHNHEVMTHDQLLRKTSERFPQFQKATLFPIYEGGSDREFYRCKNVSGATLILVRYNREKAENSSYAEHAFFLRKQGISVPSVMAYSEKECLLWLQDLGEKNLWSIRQASWEERRPWYEKTLIEAARLHRISLKKVEKEVTLQPAFDHELYRWEQNYFFEYALGSLFKIDTKTRNELVSTLPFEILSTQLASLPRQLIHRDLQSQNILIFENQIGLIDFQGMRAGLAPYDLASLLCDPYVVLSPSEQTELLNFYQQEMKRHAFTFPFDMEKVFWECALQRLMQALGCYGFLGLHRGKSHFLEHVPSALKGLREALAHLNSENHWKEFANILMQLRF
jgi:aminoglycoside/choline kinase family phosphotransferase